MAPAKINLGLHILRRRDDGYHDIETVLVPIEWHDRLTFEPATAFTFTCSDPALPTDERNLCVRAARILAERAGIERSGHLHLGKHIPHGAGLGGGSSDAAATLCLLRRQWQVDVADAELHEIAAGLGSDVPFFLYDQPLLATGRGEQLRRLDQHRPYVLPYPLAVIMPSVQVATAEAYRLVGPSETGRADLSEIVLSNDLDRWRHELVNDFEKPILARHPQIAHERNRLVAGGAAYAALSGSGAAVFGVFESEAKAESAAHEAGSRGLIAWWGYSPSSRNSSSRSSAQVCCSSPVHS